MTPLHPSDVPVVFAQSCTWDPQSGFLHQHLCSHTCHSGPTGFGHILVCCGHEVVTDDVRCSERCQRRQDHEQGLTQAPDCPFCGPWTEEAKLLNLLEGIEFWFHFFALLPLSEGIKDRESQLRAYQAKVVYQARKLCTPQVATMVSIRALRRALAAECEEQRSQMLKAHPSWCDPPSPPSLPISRAEADAWYVEPGPQPPVPNNKSFSLDQFLSACTGNVNFFATADSTLSLRAAMIERISSGIHAFGWPPETDANERRLVALFDRELFHHHIFTVGNERLHDLVECDRQMVLYRGEQLVARSGGYWRDVEELAGCEVAGLGFDQLVCAFGAGLDSEVLDKLQPVFDWLERAERGGERFVVGVARFRGLADCGADELLERFEEDERFGGLLSWTPMHVVTFLAVVDVLRARKSDMRGWAEIQRDVDEVLALLPGEHCVY